MRKVLTAILLTAGVTFTALGVYRGDAEEVLTKAVKICLECIGLG